MRKPSSARPMTVPSSSGVQGTEGAIGLDESDPDFLAGIGKRVRHARVERGMARSALSRAADVSERYLAQLESGEANPSVVLLRRIAAAVGMRITDLLEAGEPITEQRLIQRFLSSLPPARLEAVLRRLTEEFGQEEPVRRKRVTLIGLRGAGKTTLGATLAKAMNRRFVELDGEIEREAGISLSEVFLLYGQAGYRRIERRCLERIINSQENIVLAVGGGIVSEPETYNQLLLNCYTVWVKAAPEEHMSRVIAQGDMRPMAGHAEAMEDLRNILTAREPLYAKADVVIDTSGATLEASFEALQRAVNQT